MGSQVLGHSLEEPGKAVGDVSAAPLSGAYKAPTRKKVGRLLKPDRPEESPTSASAWAALAADVSPAHPSSAPSLQIPDGLRFPCCLCGLWLKTKRLWTLAWRAAVFLWQCHPVTEQ